MYAAARTSARPHEPGRVGDPAPVLKVRYGEIVFLELKVAEAELVFGVGR